MKTSFQISWRQHRFILLLFFIIPLKIFPAVSYSEETIDLTIPRIIDIALSYNLRLKWERLSPKIQKENLETVKSIFDPVIEAGGSTSVVRTEDIPADSESYENTLQAGVGKKLDGGSHVSFTLSASDYFVRTKT